MITPKRMINLKVKRKATLAEIKMRRRSNNATKRGLDKAENKLKDINEKIELMETYKQQAGTSTGA